jgi:hypothetical protein
MNETLLLEIEQTNLPENCTVGANVRLPVETREAAVTLKEELLTRFFSGMTYVSRLHVHSTVVPCTTEEI